ncbi:MULTISPECIES: hypothetical protein [unclassified Streptomyces]
MRSPHHVSAEQTRVPDDVAAERAATGGTSRAQMIRSLNAGLQPA